MRDGWTRTTLGNAGVTVLDCVHKTPKDVGIGHPYIAIPNVLNGRLDLASVRRISDADLLEWTRRHKPQAGDLIVTRRGRVGDSAQIPKGLECAIGQNLVLLRSAGDIVTQDYLRWYAKSPQWKAQTDRLLNVGAVFDSLNVRDFPNFTIDLPPADEQRRIGRVLDALECLIEINQRLVSNIHQVGRSLFDLRCQQGVDAAFLGAPAGEWSVISMSNASSVIETGKRPKGGVGGVITGIPSIGAESIKGLAQFDTGKLKYVPTEFAESMTRGVLESRDVLVYKDGGKPGDFRPHVAMLGDGFPFDKMVINEHVYRVRASELLSEPYLYFWLTAEPTMDFMRMVGTGAAIPGLNSTAFKSIPVAVPPPHQRGRLLPVLDSLVSGALGCAKEAMALRQKRDELLPLLMSGAVSPAEAEAAS